MKTATFQVLAAVRAPEGLRRQARLQSEGRRHEFQYTPKPGFVYVRSRAISSRTNDNFDTYPAEELRTAYRSFVGKPVFVNHHNDDISRARGVIKDAVLHENIAPDGTPDTWVEVLMEVDARRFPRLAKEILDGNIDRTSMGCNVEESECSYCGKVARVQSDYCNHVLQMKGQRLNRRAPDGGTEKVLVHEICRGLGFFENSLLVDEPADPTAFFLGVDDSGIKADAMLYEAIMREGAVSGDASMQHVAAAGRVRMYRNDTQSETLCTRCAKFYPQTQTDPNWRAVRTGDPGTSAEDIAVCSECGKTIVALKVEGKMAYETSRPHPVETLRNQQCPACTSQNTWDGDMCTVCGYINPPKPFTAPDTDVSSRVTPEEGWFDPEAKKAAPFEPAAEAAEDQTGGAEGEKDNPFEKKDDEEKPDEEDDEDEDEKKTSALVDPVHLARSATKGWNGQGDDPMTQPSIATIARQRAVQAAAAARKTADIDNEAQPVEEPAPGAPVESTQETIAEPEAQGVEPTTPGDAGPAATNTEPDATVSVTDVGGVMPDSGPSLGTTDVEQPVAGTTEVDPDADHTTGPGSNSAENADYSPEIGQGEWTQSGATAAGRDARPVYTAAQLDRAVRLALREQRDRVFGSIALARLRIAANLTPERDDLKLAATIEADDKLSTEAMRVEVTTLRNVAKARPAAAPAAQRTARRAPSLRGDSLPSMDHTASMGDDDTAIFEP